MDNFIPVPHPTVTGTFPASLLSLRAVSVTMRFTHDTVTSPYHHPGLTAYVKGLLGASGDLPPGLWLALPDSGIPAFQAGDSYHYVIYALPAGLEALDRLLHAIFNSPTAQPNDARAFGPRWRIEHCTDALSDGHKPVGRAADLTPLPAQELMDEAAQWARAPTVRLRFLSPVQILKGKEQRGKKGAERFCTDASDISGELLQERLANTFDAMLRGLGSAETLKAPAAKLATGACDLFWHGGQQIAGDGAEKPVYGLSGVIDIAVDGPERTVLWLWLVLGQHLGIGQRRRFGLGRYRLETRDGNPFGKLPRRRASLLHPALALPNLDRAWAAIRYNKRQQDFDNEMKQALWGLPPDADARSEIARLGRQLHAGEYDPPSLQGWLIPKASGGQRALAVPPLMDRVLQRAVAQTLVQLVEPVMYAHSYGYRAGRNRMQARDLLQRLCREGYTWFYESDIDNFFDAVDATLIRNRLSSLLPDDPVVDAIMAWIEAPVTFKGQVLERGGLPQGSPLSPLLANLVLDDFDADLVAAGFLPVRFADDFVVPCRSREEAERARLCVAASLREKGLTLNADQDRVARFADGLKFLGYRFVNDLAIESRKTPGPETHEDPHPGSWLAQLPTDERQSTPVAIGTGTQTSATHVHTSGGTLVGEAQALGTVVIVSQPGSLVYTREGRLWQQQADEEGKLIAPWPELGAILLLGFQRITQAALHRALEHEVPVFFTDGFGRLQGTLSAVPDPNNCHHWQAQLAAVADPERCLLVARELVAARIYHQQQALRRRGTDPARLNSLASLESSVATCTSLPELLGIEGPASRQYFEALRGLLPEWTAFDGRNRRPPRDPVNALLSLGYTMLAVHVETLVRISGLLPGKGFYHQPHGRHATLVSDLMEPFRHLVETTALSMLNRRQLGEDDFEQAGADGCKLANRARRAYLLALSGRLASAMTGLDGRSKSGHEHILEQIRALAAWIEDPAADFKAARLK